MDGPSPLRAGGARRRRHSGAPPLGHRRTPGRCPRRSGPPPCSAWPRRSRGAPRTSSCWARGARSPHPDVVVAAIDERSVQRYGRWPWSRELLAQAVARLHEAGPAAIGLDITFTDEDRGSDAAVMSEAADALGRALGDLPEPARLAFNPVLAKLEARASGSGDAALARALAGAPEVVQGVSAYGSGEAQDYLEQREVAEAELRPRMLTRFPAPRAGPSSRCRWTGASPSASSPRRCRCRASSPPGSRWGTSTCSATTTAWCAAHRPSSSWSTRPGCCPRWSCRPRRPRSERPSSRCGIPGWDSWWAPGSGATGSRCAPCRSRCKRPRARIDYPGPAEVFRTVSLADVLDGSSPPTRSGGRWSWSA